MCNATKNKPKQTQVITTPRNSLPPFISDASLTPDDPASVLDISELDHDHHNYPVSQ